MRSNSTQRVTVTRIIGVACAQPRSPREYPAPRRYGPLAVSLQS